MFPVCSCFNFFSLFFGPFLCWCYILVNIYNFVFLFAGVKYVGPNGKVNNMCKAYEAAKYDLIVISDSSILSKYSKSGWLFFFFFLRNLIFCDWEGELSLICTISICTFLEDLDCKRKKKLTLAQIEAIKFLCLIIMLTSHKILTKHQYQLKKGDCICTERQMFKVGWQIIWHHHD